MAETDELITFADLVEDAAHFGMPWEIVFPAAMFGRAGVAPTSAGA